MANGNLTSEAINKVNALVADPEFAKLSDFEQKQALQIAYGAREPVDYSALPEESKLKRFGKAFYGMTPLPLLEPAKPEEAGTEAIPGGLIGTRLLRGVGSIVSQIPEAAKYWSERIPGATGTVPPKVPLGVMAEELKTIWPELAGMVTGGVITGAAMGPVTRGIRGPTAAQRAGFVPKGLEKFGKGAGIPYSPTAVSAAERIGTLAPTGAAEESLAAVRDLEIAKGDLAQIAREFPKQAVKGPQGTLARAIKVSDYMDKLWEKSHKAPIEAHADLPIDTEAVITKIQESIPQEAIENAPSEAKAAGTWALRNFSGPKTLLSADKLLREINADIKSPAARTAYSPLLLRTKQLAASVLREQIDTTLENAGEIGVKSANQRWGALRTVAQRMTESALNEAEQLGNRTLIQRAVHTYAYLSPRSAIPHGGMAISPARMFAEAPSKSITRGMGLLERSGISPEVPPKPTAPVVTPPTTPIAEAARTPVRGRPIPSTSEAARAEAEMVASETERGPEVEVNRYTETQQRLAYMRILNSSIQKLARGSKRAFGTEEFAWIEKETGLDMTDPENIPKARKMLVAKRAKLNKVLPKVGTIVAPEESE